MSTWFVTRQRQMAETNCSSCLTERGRFGACSAGRRTRWSRMRTQQLRIKNLYTLIRRTTTTTYPQFWLTKNNRKKSLVWSVLHNQREPEKKTISKWTKSSRSTHFVVIVGVHWSFFLNSIPLKLQKISIKFFLFCTSVIFPSSSFDLFRWKYFLSALGQVFFAYLGSQIWIKKRSRSF